MKQKLASMFNRREVREIIRTVIAIAIVYLCYLVRT